LVEEPSPDQGEGRPPSGLDPGVGGHRFEAVNLLIKVKRVGHGFRNFANYRLRLLL
jgi:hypothetical protein